MEPMGRRIGTAPSRTRRSYSGHGSSTAKTESPSMNHLPILSPKMNRTWHRDMGNLYSRSCHEDSKSMRNIINLQTDLLRTFVPVVDLGTYTKAGSCEQGRVGTRGDSTWKSG